MRFVLDMTIAVCYLTIMMQAQLTHLTPPPVEPTAIAQGCPCAMPVDSISAEETVMEQTTLPPAKVWTKEAILALIDRWTIPGEENGKAMFRALHSLYERQTLGEQETHESHEQNGRGFTKFDADLLTDIAQKSEKYGSLTPKQTQLVGRRIRKYHRQLVEIANKNEQRRFVTETATQSAVDAVLEEVAQASEPAQPVPVEF